MKAVRIAAVAAALLTLAALSGVARPEGATSAPAADDQSSITVSGNGVITTTPDRATVSFGVLTRGRTAGAAGANEVDGPALDAGDRDKLYRDALQVAVGDARAKAQVLAAASGRTLGRVQTVAESAYAPVMEKAADAGVATPIEPGTQDV